MKLEARRLVTTNFRAFLFNQDPRGPSDRQERVSPRGVNDRLSFFFEARLAVSKPTGGNQLLKAPSLLTSNFYIWHVFWNPLTLTN